jgi:DNA-binding transcriptional ArsR family regulator
MVTLAGWMIYRKSGMQALDTNLRQRAKFAIFSWWLPAGKKILRPFLFRFIFNHMVEYNSKMLDRTFGALADPTRRRILAQLAKGNECVTDLARPHAMSLAAVSKHLIVLERAGLVKRRRNGRVHSLALQARPMKEAQAWIDRYRKFWEANLDQFEKYLDKLQTMETPHGDDK